MVKNPSANAGDAGWIPESGRAAQGGYRLLAGVGEGFPVVLSEMATAAGNAPGAQSIGSQKSQTQLATKTTRTIHP